MKRIETEINELYFNRIQMGRKIKVPANVSGAPNLIPFWGYPCEEHQVVTQDGYHITLFRIPYSRKSTTTSPSPYPVILWHGLANCSSLFVAGCPESSLAFVLSDAGYDVWLANARGSMYSQTHEWFDLNNRYDAQEYWNYSIDEMAKYDVPSVVDYVLKFSVSPTVSYIGFSQGTAKMIAALSINEELNDKVNHFIALAPAMKPKKIKNQSFTNIMNYFGAELLYWILGSHSFISLAEYLPKISLAVNRFLIRWFVQLVLHWQMEKFGDYDRQLKLYEHLFSTTSVQNFVHWFQIINNESFSTFQSHPERNSIEYPTKNIRTKMSLFCGCNDNISDPEYLRSQLPKHAEFYFVDYEHLVIDNTD
ncbi:Alpha/Beta hydrolase protein [Globomyces pollinis-pini]|nr:Alpha/Beta hydrolase protein [Globomyces pollinis-pini]